MDKYPIFKKTADENRAELTFKSNGEKNDMNIIYVASEQAYRNKLTFSFFQDNFGKISICFAGSKANINKVIEFYNKK